MKTKNLPLALLTTLLHLKPTTSFSSYSILELFYYQTSGNTWKNSQNWLTNTDPCTWYGITCHNAAAGGGIERVELVDNDLIGTFPPEVFQLEGLKSLILSENEGLSGSFEFIGNATTLEHLRVSRTGVKSLRGIRGVKDTLTSLYVEDNGLGGVTSRIDPEVYRLRKLKQLILSGNSIGGSISHDIGNLKLLEELNLGNNLLKGTLPAAIGNLKQLSYLNLGGNALEGTLPDELNNLDRLEGLFLNNQMVGFSGPLPDFSRLEKLTEMNLRRNKLTGTIPDTFLAASEVSTRKIYISLSYNRLTGTVPSSLSRFSQLNLYLVSNYFTGIDPELCDLNGWMDGLVETAGCDALLCPLGTYHENGRQVDASNACVECEDSAAAYLGAFECRSKGTYEADIMKQLYESTGGDQWLASNNWLRDDRHICRWFGIMCNNSNQVVKIDLSSNNLVGSFPSEDIFEGFPSLVKLNLNGNPNLDFSPEGIWKSASLEVLYLNHLGLPSLSGIRDGKSLKTLHLSNNAFTENPIAELSTLSNLEHLIVSNSNITGRLSPVMSLSKLQTLDLSLNGVSGSIPSTISNLSELRVLDLSNNEITGTIPAELEDIEALSSLKLSNQRYRSGITGTLPSFSTQNNVTTIDLSSNSFTGTIPSDFLSQMTGSSPSDAITINLANNQLTGSVPHTFTHFQYLNLYLTHNLLSFLPEELCHSPGWMSGTTNQFGCDAILCDMGTVNERGRQTRNSNPCISCPTGETTLHMGEDECVERPRVDERVILTSFYESLAGENWKRRDNWTLTESACDWYGVECKNGYVTEIKLVNNGLFGTPSTDVYKLAFLEVLDLSMNSIVYVDFDGVEYADSLKELILHGVGLESLQGIGKAKNLEVLKAGRNDFHGNGIPSDVYDLVNLQQLHLSESNLGGTIDENIGKLKHLLGFYAYDNALEGRIPTTIGRLTNLTWLSLAQNSLTGFLPPQFEQLRHLKALSLVDQTSKGGPGLGGSLLSFFTNLDLTEIFLSSNHFTGTIPDTFLEVSDTSRVYSVDLSSNDLTGTIPVAFYKFDSFNIDVTDNYITQLNEKLCEKSGWMYGNVEEFGCNAILCPAGTANALGRQELRTEGCDICTIDGSAVAGHLGSTTCGLKPDMDRERDILTALYNDCGGDGWKNATGWLDDDEGVCWWHGINCDKYGRVEQILLGGNNLVGTPPKDIFELKSLKTLSLFSNSIQFSFDGIENAKQLDTLGLDSTGLTSIEGIGKAKSLKNVNLRFNQLQGTIPEEIFTLSNLEFLTLSDNYFTGTLSPFFGDLVILRALLIGSNQLTGQIYDFAQNNYLDYLDLSNNSLMGTVPPTLLSATRSATEVFLDLSLNELTGTLPVDLKRFQNLAIHLKGNQFESIPEPLCQLSKWNYDDVRDYGCNGILCPRGTYNDIGRQSSDETPCLKCDSAVYLGSVTCDAGSGGVEMMGGTKSIIILLGALFAAGYALN